MVDFLGLPNPLEVSQTMESCAAGAWVVYNSGSSFHGYWVTLLEQEAWPQFLGGLLLRNLPAARQIVDDRWVGHSLIQGYSALRWTKKTDRYKSMPQAVDWTEVSLVPRPRQARPLA